MRLHQLVPGCALATCLLYAGMSTAQTTPDSAYFDLGRVKLQKNFTQNVTIKGEELHRFPFTNLSEAVNVWFSGNFNSKSNLVYVVDGKLLTDANSYPIQDIEEITLIQNAVGTVNGTQQQQQLILVKTKRNLEQTSGIEVSAQANLIQMQKNRGIYRDEQNVTSTTKLFQQYNLSAFKNFNRVHIGISGNYMRDTDPLKSAGNFQSTTPINFDRWRLNGYLNANVWKGGTLDINIGYTPQSFNEQTYYDDQVRSATTNYSTREKFFNSSLTLLSQILPGLTNQVKAGYVRSKNVMDNSSSQTQANSFTLYFATFNNTKTDNLLISDELRYTKSVNNFTFTPAINLSHRYFNNTLDYYSSAEGISQQLVSVNKGTSITKLKATLLTPTIDITYKNLVNITGGLQYIIKADPNPYVANYKKTFPFVTASVDVARALSSNSPVSAKVFGSYALSNRFNDIYTSLNDLSYQPDYALDSYHSNTFILDYSVPEQYFKTLTLGTDIGLLNNKLLLSYNYERRDNLTFLSTYYYSPSGYSPTSIFVPSITKIQRISVGYKLVSNSKLNWNTTLNTTTIKQNITYQVNYTPYGMIPAGKDLWTGGFTNRLRYKNWIGGVDMLYLFGKIQYSNPTTSFNSFSLQNAFIGLNVKTSAVKKLEIFANGRNLLQNERSVFADYRRYFGLGLKAGI